MILLDLSLSIVAFGVACFFLGGQWQRVKYRRGLLRLSEQLGASSDALKAAVNANQPTENNRTVMDTKALLASLAAEVSVVTTVEASAITLINGFQQRLTDAVTTAVANGATADQLAPIQDEINAMEASKTALAAAVTANTPAAPTGAGAGTGDVSAPADTGGTSAPVAAGDGSSAAPAAGGSN